MLQHRGLAKLGPSVKQDGLASQAAAEKIVRKSGTADELSRVEDRGFGERITRRNRGGHGVLYRIGHACAMSAVGPEAGVQPFRMVTISQDNLASHRAGCANMFFNPRVLSICYSKTEIAGV